ncbi:MAG: acyltransferase family protein [Butyrivibrio sp.]|jgi:surface polysaccharide O-acyltransferase-like enzyme|nr:acyltransferase family protein [Butyrivibrio sp.]
MKKIKIAFSLVVLLVYGYCLLPVYTSPILSLANKALIFLIAAISVAIAIIPTIKADRISIVDNDRNGITSRRDGLDILRTFAVVMVITVHFVISMGYYDVKIESKSFFFASIIRWLSQTCCPLFMILSGYFLSSLHIGIKHRNSIIHFLRNYIVIVILFIVYYKIRDLSLIRQLINMNYMWYINMYFGLILLCPYINLIIKWWESDYFKASMTIAIFFVLSSVGTILGDWFTNYWYGLYPIMYYLIGAFFRRFKLLNVCKLYLGWLIAIMLILQSTYTFFYGYGSNFDWIANMGGTLVHIMLFQLLYAQHVYSWFLKMFL